MIAVALLFAAAGGAFLGLASGATCQALRGRVSWIEPAAYAVIAVVFFVAAVLFASVLEVPR